MLQTVADRFEAKLAATPAELSAAQRLRYQVFVSELGGSGPAIDHDLALEKDRYDPYCDHLIVRDVALDQVVAVYRLMRSDQAARAGGFYTENEFDLSKLKASGKTLLELGRSCVHPDYRGGSALAVLWQALAQIVEAHDIDLLFGVASFHGTDLAALKQPLSLLHHTYLAPEPVRVHAIGSTAVSLNMLPPKDVARAAATVQIPGLIKAYLRLGGGVGQGAFVDHAFNTTDICLVLDTARLNARQVRIYKSQGV